MLYEEVANKGLTMLFPQKFQLVGQGIQAASLRSKMKNNNNKGLSMRNKALKTWMTKCITSGKTTQKDKDGSCWEVTAETFGPALVCRQEGRRGGRRPVEDVSSSLCTSKTRNPKRLWSEAGRNPRDRLPFFPPGWPLIFQRSR